MTSDILSDKIAKIPEWWIKEFEKISTDQAAMIEAYRQRKNEKRKYMVFVIAVFAILLAGSIFSNYELRMKADMLIALMSSVVAVASNLIILLGD